MVGLQLKQLIRCLIKLLYKNFAGVNENNRDKAKSAQPVSRKESRIRTSRIRTAVLARSALTRSDGEINQFMGAGKRRQGQADVL
jgi:hypothetical protein